MQDDRRRPRVYYLVSHPIPYHAPLFRRLAASARIAFEVVYGCRYGLDRTYDPQFGTYVDFGVPLLAGIPHRFLTDESEPRRITSFWGLTLPFMRSTFEEASTIVLHGWRSAMHWQAAAAARTANRRYWIRAETPLLADGIVKVTDRRIVRDALVRGLLRGAQGALAIGTANSRFYRRLGVPVSRIRLVPYCVDNNAVRRAADYARAKKQERRAELGIPAQTPVAISVGKFLPRKRQLDLIEARARTREVYLILVGSGETEGQVRRRAHELAVDGRVRFLGFRSQSETWEMLGLSDLFLHAAAFETWGLVINEAVAAGLPTLVTNECGAAEDLVSPGRTGEILSVGDVNGWADAIGRWARRALAKDFDAPLLTELADRHSLDATVCAFEAAVLTRPTLDHFTC